MLEELKAMLKKVPDTYDDFEFCIIHMAEKDDEYCKKIYGFIKNNPNVTTSQIAKFEAEKILGIKPVTH